jgi:hypothetical protein
MHQSVHVTARDAQWANLMSRDALNVKLGHRRACLRHGDSALRRALPASELIRECLETSEGNCYFSTVAIREVAQVGYEWEYRRWYSS